MMKPFRAAVADARLAGDTPRLPTELVSARNATSVSLSRHFATSRRMNDDTIRPERYAGSFQVLPVICHRRCGYSFTAKRDGRHCFLLPLRRHAAIRVAARLVRGQYYSGQTLVAICLLCLQRACRSRAALRLPS